MIKKIILYCCIGFFVACGSNKSVVRTSKHPIKSSPKVNIIRKPVQKTRNPIVIKSHETKEINSNQTPIESTEILVATTRVKVTTALVLEYINRFKGIAKKDMIEYGIPASITLGQGILESGSGTGPLSTQANNHFGIKCHKEWTGASVKYDDDEAQECFRKYDHPDDSYRDHSLFLMTRDHYSSLFKLDISDYKSWAIGLKSAGYATDIAYPTKLISLIERYQLNKYDLEVLGPNYVPVKTNTIEETTILIASNDDLHQVVKGDTLYSISKRYRISIEDIKKKNNISDSGISIGQKLIVK